MILEAPYHFRGYLVGCCTRIYTFCQQQQDFLHHYLPSSAAALHPQCESVCVYASADARTPPRRWCIIAVVCGGGAGVAYPPARLTIIDRFRRGRPLAKILHHPHNTTMCSHVLPAITTSMAHVPAPAAPTSDHAS